MYTHGLPRACVLSLALAATSSPVAATGATDDLIAMARTLAGAERFSFTLHMRYDAVQASGRKVEFSEIRRVQVMRPNRIRVDAVQSDGDERRLLFDGKTLTLFNERENVYSQTQKPGDLDAAVRYAVRELGVRVPLARLFVSTLPDELGRLAREVVYVERSWIGTEPTDHIAGSTPDVDFQMWIGDDRLLRRLVITYPDAPGEPQMRADFSDWNFAQPASAAIFTFYPPEGAEKIPTLLPAGSKAVGGTTGEDKS
jgi:hypothetical protein